MRYRLIVTDIDGTLLGERKEVTPRVRAALRAFREQGGTVVLSTARPPRSALPLYADLGLNGPLITYNGALLYDPQRLGAELCDEWHVDRVDERLRRLHATGRIRDLPIVGDVDHAVATTTRGVSKLYCVVPNHVRTALELQATIALGDDENDLPALGAAGLGIAMGNASERVKAAAGAVTGPNTADGWAEAVERHALARRPAIS